MKAGYIYLAMGLAVTTQAYAWGNKTSLSDSDISRVEAGQGSVKEENVYLFSCMEKPACRYGLVQAWGNAKQYPFNDYVTKAAQQGRAVPALIQGTDVERMVIENGAATACAGEDGCRKQLVEIVKSLHTLPPDMLEAAYRDKTQIDKDRLSQQVRSNFEHAVQAAQSEPVAAPPVVAALSAPTETPSSVPQSPAEAAGKILDFETDPNTGDYVSLSAGADGNGVVTLRRGGDAHNEVKLADVMGHPGKYLVQTARGDQFEAQQLKLTYRGFVTDGSSWFHSYTETGLQKIMLPEQFHVAGTQAGDVFKTGYVLLERDAAEKGDILSPLKSIGASLGVNKKQDYLLMGIHDGKTYAFNIDNTGKEASYLSNCRQKNAVLNICNNAISQESMYKQNGFKNLGHYAWLIRWYRTPKDAYVIALEDTLKNLTATRLSDGKKVVVFNRTMGVADFAVTQKDDGGLTVVAKLGFSQKEIADLESVYDSLPSYEANKKVASSNVR